MSHSFMLDASFFALLLLISFVTAQSGTCSSTSKCVSGCCSSSGYCGFGPDYCGKTCISDCDAKAECGEYAAVNGTLCPLNVCCSQYGFCGTTADFCGTGCQSGCAAPKEPGCSSSGGSTNQKSIGYYESWSSTRSCNAWQPSDIDPTKWTHLNFAFALIDQNTYSVAQMDPGDTTLYTEFTNLKQLNPTLSVFISVGGWSAGGAIFSSMVSSASNRAAFISSLQTFMNTYSFDGVDIDWEYPVAPDRGGNPADFTNYITFLSELRSAIGTQYGISATLPSSYWYMQNFDIVNMEKYLDWFNIMTYDIHGTWDGQNPYTQAVVQAHTNLTEIKESLDLLWRNNIDPSKVVLGLGFYGRSFTLKDPSCSTPGCPFSGGANPGKCTDTSGILSDQEIQDIISANSLTPTLDTTAAVKYMTWDSNQWVSYDDAQTFQMKLSFANSECLAGTMVWAVDLDAAGLDTSVNSLINGLTSKSADVVKATAYSNSLSWGLFWTTCLPYGTSDACPTGYRPIAWGHGKVFDADLQYNTGEGCHGGGPKGFQRALCAANNIQYSSLQWGPGSASKACNSKCPPGWVIISKNSHIAGQKSGCKSGKYAPLCAYKMYLYASKYASCYPSTGNQLLSGGLAARADPDGITDFTLQDSNDNSISSKQNKRQVFGGDGCGRMLPVGDIPLEIPAYIYPRYGGYFTDYVLEPTSVAASTIPTKKPTKTLRSETTTTTYSTKMRTCDGGNYPQACFHYSSVAQSSTYSRATCSNNEMSSTFRPLPVLYNLGHKNKIWSGFIAESYVNPNNKRKSINCQRDEWPPAHFQQGRIDGWIRLLPGDQNSGAANRNPLKNGWAGFCKFPPEKEVKKEGGPIIDMGSYYLLTSYTSTIITLNVMSYTWTSVSPPAGDPWGLTANHCRPSVLTSDVGFALQTDDWWYTRNNGTRPTAYNDSPGTLTNGKTQPIYKRWVDDMSTSYSVLAFDDGNSTRLATDEEMEALGYTRCMTPNCEEELEMLRGQQASAGLATAVVESQLTNTLVVMTTTSTPAETDVPVAGSRPIAVVQFSQVTATAAPNIL